MDEIRISKPTKHYKIYFKVYKTNLITLLLTFVALYVTLNAYIILYASAVYAVFLLFTGGYGGLESYPFGFVIENEQKRIVIHYFKVPFIKIKKEYSFDELVFEYTLPKNFSHYKNDGPWLLIYHKEELVFYINQRNVVGWSREEILSIYSRLTGVIQV